VFNIFEQFISNLGSETTSSKRFLVGLTCRFSSVIFFLYIFGNIYIRRPAVCLSLAVNMTKFDNFVIIIIMLSASVIFLVCPE
jgi:hypothetical protein